MSTVRHGAARVCAIALLLAVFLTRAGAQTLPYDRVTFLNGFASGDMIWKIPYPDLGNNVSPPQYLGKQIDLQSVKLVNVDSLKGWAGEVEDLAAAVNMTGRHVFVGHSLGGVVARGLYLNHWEDRPNFFGIITLATPHQGTVLADSIYSARNFLLDVQRRVNDGIHSVEIFTPIFAVVGSQLVVALGVPGIVAGPVFLAAVAYFEIKASGNEINVEQLARLAQVPAVADLRTRSATVMNLNANTPDAGIQRATVVGRIGFRNAVFRLRQSLARDEGGFNDAVGQRDNLVKALHFCKVAGYTIVVTAGLARRCAYGIKVLGRVDDRWAGYVNGFDYIQVRGLTLRRARNVPFDGIVSNERSKYPGLTDATRTFVADGANHQNIYSSQRGLDQVAAAMRAFGMLQVTNQGGALAATIMGPSSLADGKSGTWTATVSGGASPFRYQWSGMLSGTARTISGPGEGTLRLDVWDQMNTQITLLKRVTAATGCGTQKAC